MSWLAGQDWPWLLVSFLAGGTITWLLLVRKITTQVPVTTERSAPKVEAVRAAAPAAPAAAEVARGRFGEGSADPLPDGSMPNGYEIKGNEDSMLYHPPDSPHYAKTKAEAWFREAKHAEAAGFTHWKRGREKGDKQALASVPAGRFGEGSADPLPDGSAPSGFTIKGNADSMLYHPQDSPYYARTIAEAWFLDEETARAAGFKRWDEKS